MELPRFRGPLYSEPPGRIASSVMLLSYYEKNGLQGFPQDHRFIPARAGNTVEGRHVGSPLRLHPRSRGEHGMASCWRAKAGGSSPLARGTPDEQLDVVRVMRFIPARAGNTIRCPCGILMRPGSSPLARGTRRPGCGNWPLGRFIPARAGNTGDGANEHLRPPVHPRSRGEHPERTARTATRSGSSPLARGTRRRCRLQQGTFRFIPARAGNTRTPAPSTPRSAVHPRSRGEHGARTGTVRSQCGSSPLARGTPPGPRAGSRPARFIPARAGNTPVPVATAPALPVHPRSRGEHAHDAAHAGSPTGSSPLARGTPGHGGDRPRLRRFIPARAGNTVPRFEHGPPRPVHPRSRGEHGSPNG